MIIDRKTYKRVEWHLYNYARMQRDLQRRREEVLLGENYALDPVGIRGGRKSDTTALRAMRIAQEGDEAAWCKVVEATRRRFADATLGRVLELWYFERKSQRQICDTLFISRSAFYSARQDLVLFATIKASECGLISI